MSAGVAERPLDGCDLSISGCTQSSSDELRRLLLAQAVAAELQAMGIVNDAVEDRVGQSGISDQGMPAVHRDLAGDQGGAAAVAVFDDFEHVVALLGAERFEAPVVKDQQLDAAEGAHQPGIAAVATGQCEIGEQLGDALIKYRAVVAARLMAESAGEPTLADTGGSFDHQILCLIDPAAG